MIQLSYEVCGVILGVLLIGILIAAVMVRRKLRMAAPGSTVVTADEISPRHELEHRALVYLMTQKTDSILAALGQTIAQERQKLGVFVKNPAVVSVADEMAAKPLAVNPQPPSGMEASAYAVQDPVAASMSPLKTPPVVPSETDRRRIHSSPSGDIAGQTEEKMVRASEPPAASSSTVPPPDPRHALYQRVLPLARQGLNVTSIADALQLPEMEVAMVMRLNAAA
ncbi:hypothetical protein DESC_300050 [Desulfosarcina cetonica]|nr:hypothetical protein DESC_300050 [Desulfosarcina cetonica]